jgi:hypothetical protein
MESGAEARNKTVEEVYAGVVADNVSYNQSAFKDLAKLYPFLLYFGCIAHCFDLAMEDQAKIPEIGEIINTCRSVAVFVKSHKVVCAKFKTIIAKKGRMFVLYPDTRFSYAHLTVCPPTPTHPQPHRTRTSSPRTSSCSQHVRAPSMCSLSLSLSLSL